MPICHECGLEFFIDRAGCSFHAGDDPDGIDHDQDADHVPFALDDVADNPLHDLQAGDQVTWTDPDDALSTKTITICTIQYLTGVDETITADTIVHITGAEGSDLQCRVGELS